jgi:hypothetical protein
VCGKPGMSMSATADMQHPDEQVPSVECSLAAWLPPTPVLSVSQVLNGTAATYGCTLSDLEFG